MGVRERERAVEFVERMLEATSLGSGDGFEVVAGIASEVIDRDEAALVFGVLVQVSHVAVERLARVMQTTPDRVLDPILRALHDGI